MLQILAPLEFLDVLEEVLGLDTTTISDPIFEYSPPPINGVRVDPALFALDVGIFGKLVLLVVHIVMTEAKILGNLCIFEFWCTNLGPVQERRSQLANSSC